MSLVGILHGVGREVRQDLLDTSFVECRHIVLIRVVLMNSTPGSCTRWARV
jgi:hypothetical protein